MQDVDDGALRTADRGTVQLPRKLRDSATPPRGVGAGRTAIEIVNAHEIQQCHTRHFGPADEASLRPAVSAAQGLWVLT
ncbi:MAG: hypothetical protein KAH46_30895 [Mycobacterium sp.]|nr:hypothetical protein [Mycobacterium sp.]